MIDELHRAAVIDARDFVFELGERALLDLSVAFFEISLTNIANGSVGM